ncbi:hypothetical protein [Hyphomicrobium sulfonivorans]|uniref:hypothetical protein n=1 Tax=Hyphomicrobium sulfonivorans TaxID=121290 RepID=UPI00156D68BA|nr:hypothetical protein [Hyphomicrobium sulfonivorans]MBI1648685.1 hypothetical protein [Hyphomicrobium sulfonivorans]NSL70779.1 hypothetical protein [Hyphomicrobium sulfonivorans]
MAGNIDAVIAALRVVLDAAEESDEPFVKVEAANRWIKQLPGTWTGRWRKLMLKGDGSGDARRDEFVGHVRAVLAFLESNSKETPATRKWWSLRRRSGQQQPAAPVAAQAAAAAAKPVKARPVNLLRVRKPMPGVH